MEIRWLEDFITLARTRHFSRAADEQNVTQPTFSRRIKMLEKEMGVTLIDRKTLPLSLTPAGEIFLGNAKRISQLIKETKSCCASAHKLRLNKLIFVTSQTLYLVYYQSWLKPLFDQADIEIELNLDASEWNTKQFITALQEQRCDLMLSYWHPAMADFNDDKDSLANYLTIDQEMLIPCSAADENANARFQLPGNPQRPLPCIDFHENSPLEPAIQNFLENTPKQANLHMVSRNYHAISVKAMIEEGFGLGWLPGRLASEALKSGKLCRAGDSEWDIPVEIRLYWPQDAVIPDLHFLRSQLHQRSATPAQFKN
ncbi:MAG: LysR family transcriptional regulator [Gammaproteobacteria bacterium]|nr:MAG: LysR family transcriptional regulator [Gammaproteobacteria bacterium]